MKTALWKSVIASSILVLTWPALVAQFATGAARHAASAAVPADASATPEPPPTVRIRLFNYTGLPARLMTGAQKTVNKIFAQAGLEAAWHECPTDPAVRAQDSACISTLAPDEFGIRLMAKFEGSQQVFKLGDAHGRFINLYWNNIQKMAAAAEPDAVLACVIAHELGHLLLNTTAHSTHGIMSTEWDRETMRYASRGSLLFTAAESDSVRRLVRARMAEQQQLAAAPLASVR